MALKLLINFEEKGIIVLVPLAGIEPALLAELDFESSASTNSATGASGTAPSGAYVAKRAEYSGRARGVNPRRNGRFGPVLRMRSVRCFKTPTAAAWSPGSAAW
jgi:hypothetical protein